jgi:hypothetical protein
VPAASNGRYYPTLGWRNASHLAEQATVHLGGWRSALQLAKKVTDAMDFGWRKRFTAAVTGLFSVGFSR